MTLRNRECKVQVQASRVSARIAALTVVALALARKPIVQHGREGRRTQPTADIHQAHGAQHPAQQRGTLGGSNRLLSSRDVAAILAIPERTVRDKWKEWGLPAYRIGKHLRWKERDVYAWIERQSA
jgi:excisionase family DNA binding protein